MPRYLNITVILWTIIISGLCPSVGGAAQTVVLESRSDTYRLGGASVDIFEDPTGRLTIGDITSPRLSSSFRPTRQPVPNFGMSNSSYWVRFTVDGTQRQQEEWLLFLDHPLMDQVDLYIREGERYILKRAGDNLPMSQREIPGRNIVLPLPLENSPQTFYLHAWIPGRAQFPLSVLTKDAFQKLEKSQNYLMGAYTGFMLSICLLGLFLFMLLKDRNYLLYMLYALCFLLSQLAMYGYLHDWLFPEQPEIDATANLVLGVMTMVAGVAFAKTFLKTRITAPRVDRALQTFMAACLLILVLLPFVPALVYKQLFNAALFVAALLTIVAAVVSYRQGVQAALYFLVARCSLYAGALVFFLVNVGFLPVNLLTKDIFLFASALDVVFVSFALGDNFTRMNRRITALIEELQGEVSERAAANRALETQIAERIRLEREIAHISDNERRQISHELHDGLCQLLTGARLRFAALEDRFSASGIQAETQSLGRLLDDAVQHSYNLSRGLWPAYSGGTNAVTSLYDMTRDISTQFGIPIELHKEQGCEQCSCAHLPQLRQIAREAVFNAVKHAQASLITVRLNCTREGGIVLEVHDNGRGLIGLAKGSDGMGIRIMKHRAVLIGGQLTIEEAAGGGTSVVCTLACDGLPKDGIDA